MLICLVWGVSLSISRQKVRDLLVIFGIVLIVGIRASIRSREQALTSKRHKC